MTQQRHLAEAINCRGYVLRHLCLLAEISDLADKLDTVVRISSERSDVREDAAREISARTRSIYASSSFQTHPSFLAGYIDKTSNAGKN